MQLEFRNNRDFWAGVMLIGTGAAAIIIARNYAFGTALRMGPGYFPSVLGGAAGAVRALPGRRRPAQQREDRGQHWSLRALIVLPLALVLFGLLMEHAGFIPALLVLIFGSAARRQGVQARRGAAAGGRADRVLGRAVHLGARPALSAAGRLVTT